MLVLNTEPSVSVEMPLDHWARLPTLHAAWCVLVMPLKSVAMGILLILFFLYHFLFDL